MDGNIPDHSVLEHTTFRVPYEELNRKYRNGHKNIEKVVAKINKINGVIHQKLANNEEPIPVETVKDAYGRLCQHVKEAEKAFRETVDQQLMECDKLIHRVKHLEEEVRMDGLEEEEPYEFERHKRVRTARYIITYLLRIGKIKTAKKMAEAYGLEKMVDIEVYEQCLLVQQQLVEKNTKPCLEWIDSHRSKLRKMNSLLELYVRRLDVVDLVLSGKTVEAVVYVKKNIAPIAKQYADEMKLIMSLVIFPPQVIKNRYPGIMSDDRYYGVSMIFRNEMFKLYELSAQSVFSICLQTGLAAHKTPACKRSSKPVKQVGCYVCRSNMWPLAEGLPNAHVSVSRILCSMTGELCDDKNIPYQLPSGHVYCQNAIDKLRKGDFVTCPVTGSLIPIDQVERLYFL